VINLAHTTGSAVEMAYLNANDIRKAREAIYRDWSAFLTSAVLPAADADNIVPLHAAQ
jgi:hypothetical protein